MNPDSRTEYAVLHVDDDPDFLALAAARLETLAEDITVESAISAESALSMLAAGEYDCIVTDYKMGAVDGLEFLATVRERDPDVPVVFFTGMGSEEIASEAIAAGVTDYLTKGGGKNQFALLANRVRSLAARVAADREIERAAQLVRETYERITDGVVSLDPEGYVTYHNSHAAHLLDCSAGDLQDEHLLEAAPPLAATSFEAGLAAATDAQRPANFTVDVEQLATWLSVTVYPSTDGATVFLRDVTDLKRAEAENEALRDDLAASESKFRSFHAKVSRPSPLFRT